MTPRLNADRAVAGQAALALALDEQPQRCAHVQALHDTLCAELQKRPGVRINSPAGAVPHIVNVSVAGITFKYTEAGPVGLCAGKKAVNITTRGGDYSEGIAAELELGNRYVKTILGLFGITDFKSIIASNLDVIGMDVDAIVNKAIEEAKELAKSF